MLPDQIGTAFLQTYLPSFCREVDLVIVPSEGGRRALVDLGVDVPIEVVPNGVDLAPFRNEVRPLARDRLGAGPSDVVLVYVGRLGPEKNLMTLLQAFAGAHAAYPHTTLVLVGDGPERESLELLAQRLGLAGRVRFTGMVDYGLLPRYLAAADVFVTASVTEVHPLTVIEALAAGLPVIGIRSPGVGDTIEDGVTGLLGPNNLAGFTAVMTRMLAESELRRRMSLAARETSARFAIEHTSARVFSLYQSLVSAPPRRPRRRWWHAWQRMIDRLS
jgi:glycosyltransferase involved in cell wall biosynthesis